MKDKKRVIAVACGGDSSEHDVSMKSAEGIASALDRNLYEPYLVEIHGHKWEAILPNGKRATVDRNDFSFAGEEGRIRPDFCYVTIHGTPGEDGLLQSYLDLIGMPYSTGGTLAEAITFDKFVLNNYMRALGVRVADSMLIRKDKAGQVDDNDVIGRIGLPLFVKPASGGSSFGTTKVKTRAELRPAIQRAMLEDSDVMAEAFMQGTEITCGCYKTAKEAHVLPVTEVVTDNEFFDYDAKYNGQVSEITPARISETLTKRVQSLTSHLYDILDCRGLIRIDYIITEGEKINLLEVNTTPGMTPTSFIPQQIRAAGLDISAVLTDIIEDTLGRASKA